jgi:hypothetical protein
MGIQPKMLELDPDEMNADPQPCPLFFSFSRTRFCNWFPLCSDTHDKLKCRRCVSNIEVKPPPENSDCNSDMSQWFHASSKKGLVDYELKQIWDAGLIFVFHHKSHDQIKVL